MKSLAGVLLALSLFVIGCDTGTTPAPKDNKGATTAPKGGDKDKGGEKTTPPVAPVAPEKGK